VDGNSRLFHGASSLTGETTNVVKMTFWPEELRDGPSGLFNSASTGLRRAIDIHEAKRSMRRL